MTDAIFKINNNLEEAFDAYYSTGMNVAQALQVVFDGLEYDDETNCIADNREFRHLVNTLGTYTEDCPESFDSSRSYTFGDGSKAHYTNPCQEAFTASFKAEW